MFAKMRRTARQATEIHAVLSLLATGASDYEIARRTGIPRSTVLNWRHGKIPGNPDSDGGRCARCGGREHPHDELPVAPYAYLLGQYLGDGCLFRVGKAGFALRISSDSAYPGIIRECCQAIEAVRGRRPYVYCYPNKRLSTITSYWRSWPCLFPQHGVNGPSVSPQLRPSVLPTGGRVFSPLVAIGSPHCVGARPSLRSRAREGEAERRWPRREPSGQGHHPLAGGCLGEPVAVGVVGDEHVGVVE
jgi:Homeodomain-like domain